MNFLDTIFLGLVQGLTEFIPVSSSGHLVLAQNLLNMKPDHLFIEYINFGTTFALLIYFREKIWQIAKDIFVNKKYNLFINILLTSLPAGLVGYTLSDFIDSNSFFNDVYVVLWMLPVAGIIMIYIDKIAKNSRLDNIEHINRKQALGVGIIQIFALVPGISRSASTIVAGRLLGFTSRLATEYSFLAAIPIMIGVSLKLLIKDGHYLSGNLEAVVVSNIVALIAGLFAIRFMISYLSTRGLKAFGYYRIAVVILALIILNVR